MDINDPGFVSGSGQSDLDSNGLGDTLAACPYGTLKVDSQWGIPNTNIYPGGATCDRWATGSGGGIGGFRRG